jgi:hypothetical protein
MSILQKVINYKDMEITNIKIVGRKNTKENTGNEIPAKGKQILRPPEK